MFSGEEQYGVLIAEIDPSNIILFYLISREIGNMLRLYQLSKEQMIMRKKLEQSVLEIQEKNEVLNFISYSTKTNSYPPTVREISDHFNISIRAVQDHIAALQKKGFISIKPKSSRSIKVLQESSSFQEEPETFIGKVPFN